MWTKIGGVIGILAILGLVVAVVQLIQSREAAKAQDMAQATQIAVLEKQLNVQREMATLQANTSKSEPAATAAAARVAELESTAIALVTVQAGVKATALPSVPTPQPHPPSTPLPGLAPTTPEGAASTFGGPPASEWKPCPAEVGCWMFKLPGKSHRVSVPEYCLNDNGSIDGWRYNGGYPGKPDSIEGTLRIWNTLEAATIHCK